MVARTTRPVRLLGLLVLAAATTAPTVLAAGDIRFYERNRKGQLSEVMFVRNSDEPGCHNFLGSKDVHRVGQIGFAWCEIYTAEDCAAGSAVTATWSGRARKGSDKSEPSTRMSEGNLWLLDPQDNVEVESWRCVEKDG